jgi:hypothetical protein
VTRVLLGKSSLIENSSRVAPSCAVRDFCPAIGALSSTPIVTVSPSTLTFPSQAVGTTSSTQAVILTNVGTSRLNLTNVAITGSNASKRSERKR